jgi:hypothetical protein
MATCICCPAAAGTDTPFCCVAGGGGGAAWPGAFVASVRASPRRSLPLPAPGARSLHPFPPSCVASYSTGKHNEYSNVQQILARKKGNELNQFLKKINNFNWFAFNVILLTQKKVSKLSSLVVKADLLECADHGLGENEMRILSVQLGPPTCSAPSTLRQK